MHSPTKKQLEATNQILRYLKGTSSKGILFQKNKQREIESFADVDWVGSIEDNKSTTRYFIKLW